jgi:hypothetical protein
LTVVARPEKSEALISIKKMFWKQPKPHTECYRPPFSQEKRKGGVVPGKAADSADNGRRPPAATLGIPFTELHKELLFIIAVFS